MRWLRHPLPLPPRPWWLGAWALAALAGLVVASTVGPSLDASWHDRAVAAHARPGWEHVAIVALDDGIPADVGRVAMLPLWARAAEAATGAGAVAVYLDAAVIQEVDPAQRFAKCVEADGSVRRSRSACVEDPEWGCGPGELVSEPLRLSAEAAGRFHMLPMLGGPHGSSAACAEDVRLDHGAARRLLGARAGDATVSCADLPADDAVIRRTPAVPGHASVQLASALGGSATGGEACTVAGREVTCARVRFSEPSARHDGDARPVLRLSEVARCDGPSEDLRGLLAGRVVLLQTTAFSERVDLFSTPMSRGPTPRLTPGPQILADAIETHRAGDGPRPMGAGPAGLLVALAGLLGLAAGARWRPWAALLTPVALVAALHGLALAGGAPTLLAPLSAVGGAAFVGLLCGVGGHLVLGTRRSLITARYLPAPVRKLLLQAGGPDRFRDRKVFATVLISDIAGYTTLTDALGSPAAIFALLNDYLDYTTRFMQDEHGAWVEGYVGDEVCFYWPDVDSGGDPDAERACVARALQGAVALADAQRAWFDSLGSRPIGGVRSERLAEVAGRTGAGIGLAAGPVLMGNQGPPRGVRKFGILGAPLNLASRLEGLTRRFGGLLIADGAVAEVAPELGLQTRLIGRIRVKGRLDVVEVHAIGRPGDDGFATDDLAAWDRWRLAVEAGADPGPSPPGFERDGATLLGWRSAGRWDAEASCWAPQSK